MTKKDWIVVGVGVMSLTGLVLTTIPPKKPRINEERFKTCYAMFRRIAQPEEIIVITRICSEVAVEKN